MKHFARILPIITLLFVTGNMARAQVPTCTSDVPYFYVNLVGQPAGTWISPNHSRHGTCCTTANNCTSFDLVLDSMAIMVNFEIASGAIPSGVMFYQIDCGTPVSVGSAICITGSGVHHLTFCKPGSNANTYRVTSIPRPIFPRDDTVRYGCSKYLKLYGLDSASVTWTSIYPGSSGAYNSYLNLSNKINVLYTPGSGAPPYIDYKICGTPIATSCGLTSICDTVRVYNLPVLTATVTPTSPSFCAGTSGVTVSATAAGGNGSYTYTWKNSSGIVVGTGSSYTATTAGTYTFEVRDGLYSPSLCNGYSVSVPVSVAYTPTVNAGADQTVCTRTPTAYLNATVTNATGGTWSGGAGTYSPSATSLSMAYTPTSGEIAAGSVRLILTSTGAGGGCINARDTVTITYPPILNISLDSTRVPCANNTGTLTPTVTGGTGSYTYRWNTGASTANVSGRSGTYCLYVSDGIGCATSACANILAPPALSIFVNSTDISSHGATDGTANATVSGGTPGYSYHWSDGQTTRTATALGYGIYTVTATDTNGCSISSSAVVSEPRCFALGGVITSTNEACYGNSSAMAIITPSGGTAPYTFLWNDVAAQTNDTASGLVAGAYNVLITDASGCMDIEHTVITQPAQLANTMTHTNVIVIGASTGTAAANTTGGTTPYTYHWSNGASTATVTGLVAGTYTVGITDAHGCTYSDSVRITEPPCANIAVAVASTNVSCAGGSNGSASAAVLFGNPPYTYRWSTSATTASITGLTAGAYTINIQDSVHCTAMQRVTITQPSVLSISLDATDITCNAYDNGTIDLTVTGGTFPYSFSWSNGVHVEDLANLSAGTYSVTVTDANGCTATGSATIRRPNAIIVTYTKTDVTCNAGNTGAIDVSVAGGIPPYAYSWSNGATTQDLSGISSGYYTLTVTDANRCFASSALSVIIEQPDSTHVVSVTTPCPAQDTDVVYVTVSAAGGTGGLRISYDNGATYHSVGDNHAYLTAGTTYYLMVKDSNNCISPHAYVKTINAKVTLSGVAFSNCFSPSATTASVTATPAGGAGGAYRISFDNGATFGSYGVYTQNLPVARTYSVVAKDSLGCLSRVGVIAIPDVLRLTDTLSVFSGSNISCHGLSDGYVHIAVTGGAPPYTYLWSNGATTQNIDGVPAGTYSVTVTDNNGCTRAITGISLTQPATLVATGSTVSNVSCNGGSNGSVRVSTNGGTTPYTYNWSTTPLQTTSMATGLTIGTYSVAVTDAHGCTANASATVTEPTTLTASASTVANVACNGGSNGSATVTPGGGTTPYTYRWSTSPLQTTSTASGLAAGTYTVTVTDAHSCTATSSATITQPTALTASASTVANVSCNGGNDGSVTVTPGGGTLPYTYSWNSSPLQTTSTATGLTARTYTVTVTDAHSCTARSTATVTQPTRLTASASTVANVQCNGGNDGSVTVNPGGGTLPYTYSWSTSPLQTTSTATGLTAGTYTITVTDAHSCTATSSATITQPNMLTASASTVTNVACNGGNDGSVRVVPGGGTTPYTYSWSTTPLQTTSMATGLIAGTYSVTVTDAHSCTAMASATVNEATTLVATASTVNNVACNGGNNGSVTVSTSGGTTPYTYSWSTSPMQTTSAATGLAAGTYTVTVTDAHSCRSRSTATITEPTMLTASASTVANVACNGGNDGSVTVTPGGGTLPYTYSWSTSPVQTTSTATGLTAGTYTVTVTDAHSCTAISSATITQPNVLTAAASTVANVQCNGGNDGSVTVTPGGGTLPYTYSWSTSPLQTTSTATGLTAGTYTVTVTDAHSCTAMSSATITQPTMLTASASTDADVLCNGGNNGSATVTPGGGTMPYTYSWSTSPIQTTATATSLTAGTYTVTVTDAHSCTAISTATITQPTMLTASASTVANVACNGGNDGSVMVTPGGGTTPYTYSWNSSPVQTTATATGLMAGMYMVTVTDAHSCTATSSATVTQPTTLTASASTVADVACNGGNDGSVTVAPGGGTMPYTYSWSTSPVQTTATATGLTAGMYMVTVTDAHSCTASSSATITQPTMLTATASTDADVLCNGGNDGSVTVTPGGGTMPYTYSWTTSPVQTTATATGLTAGTYMVTVTDAHSCTQTASATVAEPTMLDAVASTTADAVCNGAANGSVSVMPSGGTMPYTYSWTTSPVQTTADATGLTAGTYSVTVTDAHGCTKVVAATVSQPTSLEAVANTIGNVSCKGGNNGSVSVTPSGGTTPYTYSWNTMPVQTTATATGLMAGAYSVLVTDAHGCTKSATTSVTEPTMLDAVASTTSNVACNGGNNGSVTVVASGGTMPYAYSWNSMPIQTTATATGLTARMYSVTVTDAHGCMKVVNTSVTEPTMLNATAMTVADVLCNGGNNGSVSVTASGGTTPYSYSWSTTPVQTTATATGLIAGAYMATVTDAHGCIKTASATIGQPTMLTATASTVADVACNGGNNGSVMVTPGGGTSPYNYSWNTTPVQATATATGLIAGTYIATITDAHGCIKTASATVTQPDALSATASTVANVSCNGGTNGSVAVTAGGGVTPYTYSWTTSPLQTTATATGIPMGTYTVTVTDAHHCMKTASASVSEPTPLTAIASTVTNVSCNGGNNGSSVVVPGGGTAPYTYNWTTTPVQTTATAASLIAGTYSVTVTDAHGCTKVASVVISQPAAMTTTASTLTNVSCNGGNNGSLSVVAGGGTTPYSYSWNSTPVQTTATATGLIAGIYSVTVTDAHGCIKVASASVTQPTALTAAASVVRNVSCNGGNNGSVQVAPGGGTTPYTYRWNTSPVQTTATATGLIAGTYSVTVTDAHGCSKTAGIAVTEPPVLNATMVVNANVSCNGGNNGAATVTPTGGTTPYAYSWNTTPVQTSAAATGLRAGSYAVTITDANGCIKTVAATITEPTLLTSNSVSGSILCKGGTTTVTVSAAGGTSPYTGTGSFTVHAGTFNYTVTDAHGCTATTSVTVTEPSLLTAASVADAIKCNGGTTTVTVSGSGGVTPYSGIGTYTVSAGSYRYLIHDANGCAATTAIAVTEPAKLNATASADAILCNGGTTVVTVAATGGVTPYVGVGTFTVNAGSYNYSVTDANGCIAAASVMVAEPTLMKIATSSIDATCNTANGTAVVMASGGVTPYQYTWDATTGNQITDTARNLKAGEYSVSVSDHNGCTQVAKVIVGGAVNTLAMTYEMNPVTCNGAGDGSIFVNASGGTAPFTYSWSNGMSGSKLNSIGAGDYTVTVTDVIGCNVSMNIVVTQPDALVVTLTPSEFGNGYNLSAFKAGDGSIKSDVSGGTSPYEYLWSNQMTTPDLSNLSSGEYSLKVTDKNGCSSGATVKLSEPALLEMPNGFSPNGDGKNDFFVIHGIDAYPNNSFEVFNRWGNVVFSANGYNNTWNGQSNKGEPLADGTYFVILKLNDDANQILTGYVDLRR